VIREKGKKISSKKEKEGVGRWQFKLRTQICTRKEKCRFKGGGGEGRGSEHLAIGGRGGPEADLFSRKIRERESCFKKGETAAPKKKAGVNWLNGAVEERGKDLVCDPKGEDPRLKRKKKERSALRGKKRGSRSCRIKKRPEFCFCCSKKGGGLSRSYSISGGQGKTEGLKGKGSARPYFSEGRTATLHGEGSWRSKERGGK